MVRREIDFDEETDRILSDIAQDYQGDLGKALAELVHAHKGLEDLADASEEVHRDSLIKQVEQSERDFAAGRVTSWDEIRRRNSL